jgi:hypothetical protein
MITLRARLLSFVSFANLSLSSLKSERRLRFGGQGLFALLLLGAISVPAHAQSVTLAGLQTPIGYGLSYAEGVAVDGAGDVFFADSGNLRVVESPRRLRQQRLPDHGMERYDPGPGCCRG